MDFAEFNYIESILWFVIALGLSVKSFQLGKLDVYFQICLIASIAFVAFGISDIIEAKTGSWWRPFSLLALKASCVVTFVLCFIKFKKLQGAKKT